MSIDNFRKFHRNNPKVFDMVLKYAYKQKDKGRTHYSIEIIMNVIRYHVDLDTVGDQFKINNNYKAFYSRMAMEYMLDDTFFATRGSIADDFNFQEDINYYNSWLNRRLTNEEIHNKKVVVSKSPTKPKLKKQTVMIRKGISGNRRK